MGGFVPLPSPYNPSIAAAGEAARGASAIEAAGINAKNAAIRQARTQAQQQANQAAIQQQRDISNRFRLAEMGAIPAEIEGRDSSGLITHTPNPDLPPEGGGTFLDVPLGNRSQRYYIPTAEQKQVGGFMPAGQLAESLKAAGWDGKHKITPAQSHALMQALNEAQPKDNETYDIDTSGQFLDQQGNATPVMIGRKSGKVRPLDLSNVWRGAQTGAAPAEQSGGTPGSAFDMRNWQQYVNQGQDWRGGPDTGSAPPLQSQQPGAQTPAAPAQAGGGLTFRPKKEQTPQKETPDDWIRMISDPNTKPADLKRATKALEIYRQPEVERAAAAKQAHEDVQSQRAETNAQREQDRAEKQRKELIAIGQKKETNNRAATKAYIAAHKAATSAEEEQDALDEYRSQVDANQSEYETSTGGEMNQVIPHNDWATRIQGLKTNFPGPANPRDPRNVRKKKTARDPEQLY